MKSRVARWAVFCVLILGVLSVALYALKETYMPRSVPEIESYQPWDPELVDFVGSLPVQEGGRTKPFSTWAMYRLYSIHSKKKIKVRVGGEKIKISATEWMLDSMFRPDVANGLPSFRMEDSLVAEALKIQTGTFKNKKGVEVTKKRRDFYSYDEIENPDFVNEYSAQQKRNTELLGEGKVPKGFDAQKSNLITSIGNYRQQTYLLEMARFFITDMYENTPDGKKAVGYTQEELKASLEAFSKTVFINMKGAILREDENVLSLWRDSEFLDLRMMPPSDKDNSTWLSYNQGMKDLMLGEAKYESERYGYKVLDVSHTFSRWLHLVYEYKHRGEKGLLKAFKDYKAEVEVIMSTRGETMEKTVSEKKYFDRHYFANAMGWFFLAVFSMILLLPAPSSLYAKWVSYAAVGFTLTGVIYILSGLVHRWLIMERYPLGKLYDTILVITVVSVLVLLFMELLSRRKVCLGVAVTMGLMGMYLAGRFEVGNGEDTLKPLQAVLNSDYWLITHVTCITIGYAGGLVSAFISIFYLLIRMTGIDNGDKEFRRAMTRLAYGAACFTMIFSLVGTILGGVWANDSWGRFWGWDPKENGALMIVLWFLAVLHARLAGYIKEWGIHICMVLGANIIAFSWWGVNFLSTGLHNYGFASGGSGEFWLNVFYILMLSIAIIAFGFAWYDTEMKKIRKRQRADSKDVSDADDGSAITEL